MMLLYYSYSNLMANKSVVYLMFSADFYNLIY